MKYKDEVLSEIKKKDTVVIAVNFTGGNFPTDYIFSSNMRRFHKIQGKVQAVCITTSNMKECQQTDYVVNFASYASESPEIIDNSGLMVLRLLIAVGVKKVSIAGMDGYSTYQNNDYYDQNLEYDFSAEAKQRNLLISEELKDIRKQMKLNFITPSYYSEQ